MEQIKGYVYRLKPKAGQVGLLRRIAGCNRFVWNTALALQKRAHSEGQPPIFYVEMSSFLTHWKRDPFPWLYEAPADTLQQTLRDLDGAWKKCVAEGAGAPRFKKRGRCRESFRFPTGFAFDGRRVKLPKIGWVGFFKSRAMVGTPRNITIFERAGKWYMAVCCKAEVPDPIHPSTSVAGMDMGVTRFATLSDGTFIEPLNSFRRLETLLSRAQRKFARTLRGSRRRERARLRIARIQARIADARKDFLHKNSTRLCNTHAELVIEDLRVKNMSASARGTMEEPGRHVRAKSGLNKSILDQGWGAFRLLLEYKMRARGGRLTVVPAAYTSQTCSRCGTIDAASRKSQSRFSCMQCGFECNADENAAVNILRAGGHPVPARGGLGDTRPVKREPLKVVPSGILAV